MLAIATTAGFAGFEVDDLPRVVLSEVVVALETADVVGVDPGAKVEGVFNVAGSESVVSRELEAVEFVFAVVGTDFTPPGTEALEEIEPGWGEQGCSDIAKVFAVSVVEFVPVAFEAVVIGGSFKAQIVGRFDNILKVGAVVFGLNVIVASSCITPVRVAVDVAFGEAGVGFVSVEIGGAVFEL